MDVNLLKKKYMKNYNIYFGIQGVNPVCYRYTIKAKDKEEATHIAYNSAVHLYNQYPEFPNYQDSIKEAVVNFPEYPEEEILDIARDYYSSYVDEVVTYFVCATDMDDKKDNLINFDNYTGKASS
jgi:hypothetical protein